MDTPQISRSGRVLKKSAKVKEMEDFDINDAGDVQGKSRKKGKSMDDFHEYDDKQVAPIKIPKVSFNMQATKRKMGEMTSAAGKQVFKSSFQGSMKGKQDVRRQIYPDSSDGSKESDSSSVSSESSSSSSPTSSDASDDDLYNTQYRGDRKVSLGSGLQSLSLHQEKVIVEQQGRYESPMYMEQSSGMSSDDSEDVASDKALVIAEDSDESVNYAPKGQRGSAKKKIIKKDPTYAPRQGGGRRKPPAKNTDTAAKKRKPGAAKPKPLSAYMLWCSENRKKIAASSGSIGFGNIGKKMGEAWQALPEKEKMVWRQKAKQLALKSGGNIINTGTTTTMLNKTVSKPAASITDDVMKGLTENSVLGTAPIDAASHLKLLGDSLTVIGQRLIEHEGQLAVSGIYSVLLDTLLCAIGPLLCLTTEITGLEHLDTNVFKRTLDHIAYFMPGL